MGDNGTDTLVARIVALALPVLLNDTCFLLDVVRNPTRDTIRPEDSIAAMKIVDALTGDTPRLVSCIAQQVGLELQENRTDVEGEAANALTALAKRLLRMDAIIQAFGGSGTSDMAHLHGHRSLTNAALDRWLDASQKPAQPVEVPGRAIDRVNRAGAPARKGKQSIKDCVITETYLDLAGRLRAAGFQGRIVFASSNTGDFCDPPSNKLKADIAAEFAELQIDFAPNFGTASHLLGLTG